MTQSTKLGVGRVGDVGIHGFQPGKSRTGSYNALSAQSWGSQIPHGRLVVFSPVFNQALAAGNFSAERTVMLPDATGDYLVNPVDGTLLKDNAQLLTDSKYEVTVGNFIYRVAGVAIIGDNCDNERCDQPASWPIGNYQYDYQWQYTASGRAMTVQTHGYANVWVGEDVDEGQNLAFVDAPDSLDTSIAVQSLGYFVQSGNGVQDLPETWKVVRGAKAGQLAEIFIGA